MEKVTSGRGGVKVLGTIICIGGSLNFTFWRKGYLLKGFVQKPLINIYNTDQLGHHGNENWFKDSALIVTSHIAWIARLILEAMVSKDYSAPLSLNTLICFLASLQSSFVALFHGRNPTLWKLDWNVQLLTIKYCGVINSALLYYLQRFCISVKGPVFAATFTPLQLVIVALFSAIAFAERLHLGGLIGAFLIVWGFIAFCGAKRKIDFC